MATLDLQGIQCAYGKNVVLDDVNISLNNGVTALLGLNGAGKTTLIKTIMRLIKPKNGKIVFNGEDIYKMKSRYYAYVGYMPQTFKGKDANGHVVSGPAYSRRSR